MLPVFTCIHVVFKIKSGTNRPTKQPRLVVLGNQPGGGGCDAQTETLETSSVASPICQEGQSERTFPIFVFSSRFFFFSWFSPFFPIFPLITQFWQIFHCQGGHSAPFPHTGYGTARNRYLAWFKNTPYSFLNCVKGILPDLV